jgi:arylsulfatase A-like enzyme
MPNTDQRPNVVCIITDDTDFDMLGCYGGAVLTPEIDRLAQEGARFTQMYCAASACTPSRYNYLTGRYCGRCTAPSFLEANPKDEPYSIAWNIVLPEDEPSLGSVMRDEGYRTGYAGKWHIGRGRSELDLPELAPDDDPDDPAVDEKLRRYQARLQEEVERTGGFDAAASIVWGNNEAMPIRQLQHHNLEWITQGALDFLDTCDAGDVDDAAQPFLLYVATTAIHGPLHTLSLSQDPLYTQGGKLDAPVRAHPPRDTIAQRIEAAGLEVHHVTAGALWIDDLVGALRRKLEAMGVLENTILVFCTDHGTEPGKGTCYEKGVRIPLIMRWPDRVPAGERFAARVANVDFAPTIFEACDITPPDDMAMDGESWLPQLLAGPEPVSEREEQFYEFGYTRAVGTRRWKYVALRYPSDLLEGMTSGALDEAPNHIDQRLQGQMNIAIENYPGYFDPDQLYDLEADPMEQHNLAEDPDYADVLADMKARLQRYLDTFEHPFDLEVPPFMRSERYQELADATRAIGTDYIPWYTKKHNPRYEREE